MSPIELGADIAKHFFDGRGDKSIGLYRGHVFDIDEKGKDGSVLYHVSTKIMMVRIRVKQSVGRLCTVLYHQLEDVEKKYHQIEDVEINE